MHTDVHQSLGFIHGAKLE